MQDEHGIGGAHNRVAGRDYYENPVIIAAAHPPDRPGLVHCPACDRAGLSPAALICPDCAHDLGIERRRLLRCRHRLRVACLGAAAAAALTGAHLSVDSERYLGDSVSCMITLMWLSVAVVWLQWWCLHARA